MKNKTAIKISSSLDVGYKPRSSKWHLEKIAQQAASPSQSGYAGPDVMAFGNALSNTMFARINASLSEPYRLLLNAATVSFYDKDMPFAPAGPSQYHAMLSGLAITTTEINVGEEEEEAGNKKEPDESLIGYRKVANLDFQCFMTGYDQFPLARAWQLKYLTHLYRYYFNEEPPADLREGKFQENMRNMSVMLNSLIVAVVDLRDFFKCICDAFQGCSKPESTGGSNEPTIICALGRTLKEQSDALGPRDGEPKEFIDLLLGSLAFKLNIEQCYNKLLGIYDKLNNPGFPANTNLFASINKIYRDVVRNAADWNNEGIRLNSLYAFMLCILAFCDVAQKLNSVYVKLHKTQKSLKLIFEKETGAFKVPETECSLPYAMHLYAKFIVRLWGLNPDTARRTGLPGYIWTQLKPGTDLVNCAENYQNCVTQVKNGMLHEVWRKFNWQDIGLPFKYGDTV